MDKLLIYDETCPACRVYTKGFVKVGLLKEENRRGNCQPLDERLISRIDPERACHEIPLVDLNGGETLYGVDALLDVLGQRSQVVRYLGKIRWIRRLLNYLYAFISYNRRIMIPSMPGRWQLMDFQPRFHPGYRLALLAVVFGLIGLLHYRTVGSLEWSIVALLAGQAGLAGLFLRQTPNFIEHWLDYCAHLGMSLLIGAVILSVALPLGWQWLAVVGMALSIGQHFIRTNVMGLSPWVSVGFTVVYLMISLS